MRLSQERASAPLTPGSVVGHYVVQQQIGAGSGGVVYRAFDPRLQRAVAVKILDPCFQGEEATWALAVSEARAAGSLAHPSICAVFDVEEEDDQVYLAMELVEGRSLHAAIPGHGLSCETTMRYGAQIAAALAHAHDKGVCHGDVSSKNVMLTVDDRVKVLDFGLARFLSKSSSPAEPSAGARRDLQQLGILLCDMATGTFPPQALDVLVGTAPPSAILESAPVADLPKALRSVIARCLDTDPARCYQRAQQAAADLEAQLAPEHPGSRAWTFKRRGATIAAAGFLLVALLAVISLSAWHAHGAAVARNPAKPVQAAPAKAHPAPVHGAAANPAARVWVNTKSDIYHCSTSRFYGKTDQGKYMTQAQARASGFSAAHGRACP